MTPLERKILQVVHDRFATKIPNVLCNVEDGLGPKLAASERLHLEATLDALFDRGWLAKEADSYYKPTHAGEAALQKD